MLQVCHVIPCDVFKLEELKGLKLFTQILISLDIKKVCKSSMSYL